MRDVENAAHVEIVTCKAKCRCQLVHIVLCDATAEPFAMMTIGADGVRRIAADLVAMADRIDMRLARRGSVQ